MHIEAHVQNAPGSPGPLGKKCGQGISRVRLFNKRGICMLCQLTMRLLIATEISRHVAWVRFILLCSTWVLHSTSGSLVVPTLLRFHGESLLHLAPQSSPLQVLEFGSRQGLP